MAELDEERIDTLSRHAVNIIIDHIDTMYPQMWDGTARTARTSLRNTIYIAVTAALKELAEELGECGQD